MKEKRDKQRRKYGLAATFPMRDSSGCIVLLDRSRTTDRRLKNLALEELVAEEVKLGK